MTKIQANLIIEILGRPANHIKEAINTLVVKLGSENGVEVTNKQYHDPIPAQGSKDLFTTFAEVQAEFDSVDHYLGTIFAYMPANIEIIKPEKITLTNDELNNLGNNLVQRLHNYDAIAKRMLLEKEAILNELKKVSPESFKKLTAPMEPQTKKKSPRKKKSR